MISSLVACLGYLLEPPVAEVTATGLNWCDGLHSRLYCNGRKRSGHGTCTGRSAERARLHVRSRILPHTPSVTSALPAPLNYAARLTGACVEPCRLLDQSMTLTWSQNQLKAALGSFTVVSVGFRMSCRRAMLAIFYRVIPLHRGH